MCGICGVLTDGGIDPQVFMSMRDTMVHRGPDEAGEYINGPISLGIRRLSIIDVSGGSQPMACENGSVVAVQNGEIYNFQSLRDSLIRKGHVLKSRSDTEVIPHLFEEYGEGFVEKLRGMFGIAVWDAEAGRLTVARDRLGIKPMYYYRRNGVLAFSSELKAFLQMPGFDPEIDPEAVDLYLTFGYVPSPHSIFRHVRKLPPGHLMTATQAGGFEVKKYWDYPALGVVQEQDEKKYVAELTEILRETIRLHLISDVPLGVFLSGGLDSSVIVMMMRELTGGPIETFSVGFREKEYSELSYAAEVAKLFGTVHHELEVDRDDVLDTLPDMAAKFDEPFADSSALPVFLLSRFARKRVTVALSGEGGDELFGGYHTYVASKIADVARRFPFSMALPPIRFAADLIPARMGKVGFDYKLKKFAESIAGSPLRSHLNWKRVFTPEQRAALAPEMLKGNTNGGSHAERYIDNIIGTCYNKSIVNNAMYLDSILFLPDDLLVKNDRMSMAHSLEARVPFLDHRLVEYAASVPEGLKVKGTMKKYILKRMAREKLGDNITMRQKSGFNIPLPMWLLDTGDGNLGDMMMDEIQGCSLPVNTAMAENLLAEHRGRRRDWSRQLWTLFNLALWNRVIVKNAV